MTPTPTRVPLALVRELLQIGDPLHLLDVLDDIPLLVVDLDEAGPDEVRDVAAGVSALPIVTVGVLRGSGTPPPGAGRLDVLLSAGPARSREYVSGDVDALLAALAGPVAAYPQASGALAQVLRLSHASSVSDALFAESSTYSMLLAGKEFATWLAARPLKPVPAFPDPPIVVRREGAVLQVILDRPRRRNAFDADMREALFAVLKPAVSDDSIERVVLSGNGPSFCSGGDLAEFGRTNPVTGHEVRLLHGVGGCLHRLGAKVEVRVHGSCIGAGVELPSFAPRVIAAADAVFRLPEIPMGLIPGAGGTVSITRRIGRHRTAWFALTGLALDAHKARAWGLVDEVLPER